MNTGEVYRLERENPKFQFLDSELSRGMAYGMRKDGKRLIIAANGLVTLTKEQAVAVFYEIGEILQEMGMVL